MAAGAPKRVPWQGRRWQEGYCSPVKGPRAKGFKQRTTIRQNIPHYITQNTARARARGVLGRPPTPHPRLLPAPLHGRSVSLMFWGRGFVDPVSRVRRAMGPKAQVACGIAWGWATRGRESRQCSRLEVFARRPIDAAQRGPSCTHLVSTKATLMPIPSTWGLARVARNHKF